MAGIATTRFQIEMRLFEIAEKVAVIERDVVQKLFGSCFVIVSDLSGLAFQQAASSF